MVMTYVLQEKKKSTIDGHKQIYYRKKYQRKLYMERGFIKSPRRNIKFSIAITCIKAKNR